MLNQKFYGEWVEYRSEEEKIEAIQYLLLFVKYYVRKLDKAKLIDTKLVDRPVIPGTVISTIGVKFCVESEEEPK